MRSPADKSEGLSTVDKPSKEEVHNTQDQLGIDRQLRKKEILERIGRARMVESNITNPRRKTEDFSLSMLDKPNDELPDEVEEVVPHNTQKQIADY